MTQAHTELHYAYPTSKSAIECGLKETGCYYFTHAGNGYSAKTRPEIEYIALVNGIELKPRFGKA